MSRQNYEKCPRCWTKLDNLTFHLAGLEREEAIRRDATITHVYHSIFRKCPKRKEQAE